MLINSTSSTMLLIMHLKQIKVRFLIVLQSYPGWDAAIHDSRKYNNKLNIFIDNNLQKRQHGLAIVFFIKKKKNLNFTLLLMITTTGQP